MQRENPSRAVEWGRKGSVIGAFFGTAYGLGAGAELLKGKELNQSGKLLDPIKLFKIPFRSRGIIMTAFGFAGYGAGVAWGMGIGFWAEMFAKKENTKISKLVGNGNNDYNPRRFK